MAGDDDPRARPEGDVLASPWTCEQVSALNECQRHIFGGHPYTCGKRHLPGHSEYAETHNERDHGILVATRAGWICPVCDYTQDWAFLSSTQSGETLRWIDAYLRERRAAKARIGKRG